MFKVGDKVRIVNHSLQIGGLHIGSEGIITAPYGSFWFVKCTKGNDGDMVGVTCYSGECELELIKSDNKKNNMNIKEKFVLAFLGEPEKTFRKTDITNGDGFLTTEGTAVFLAWLLKENGEKFKTDVADDLLADLEAKE